MGELWIFIIAAGKNDKRLIKKLCTNIGLSRHDNYGKL